MCLPQPLTKPHSDSLLMTILLPSPVQMPIVTHAITSLSLTPWNIRNLRLSNPWTQTQLSSSAEDCSTISTARLLSKLFAQISSLLLSALTLGLERRRQQLQPLPLMTNKRFTHRAP